MTLLDFAAVHGLEGAIHGVTRGRQRQAEGFSLRKRSIVKILNGSWETHILLYPRALLHQHPFPLNQ